MGTFLGSTWRQEDPVSDRVNLYRISFDRDQDYVEATSFRDALASWRIALARETGNDCQDAWEPDQVVLISRKPVIRKGDA